MCIITATEFKKHFGKYSELAKNEEIIVTSFGKAIFKLIPANSGKVSMAKSLIGILPTNATIGEDENERG